MDTAPAAAAGAFVVRRPRLEQALDAVLERRLGWVVAGAGFGKTTLLAGWSAAVPALYHRLGPRDRDLDAFAGGLAAALATAVAGFPVSVAAAVTGPRGPGGTGTSRAEAVAGALCDALQGCLREDLVVVLDEAETLLPDSGPARLVESLCRQAPATLRLVLAGRDGPPFRIERLRAYGGLVELTGADLAFTEEETRAVLGESVPPAVARQVHAATGGWPVAVRLAASALDRVSAEDSRRIIDGLGRGPLLDYLAREVFDREPTAVRHLVSAAALLGRADVGLLEGLGHRDAASAVASLARRGLLVNDRRPTLLPLVGEFARRTMAPGRAAARRIHERAARWLAEHGEVRAALDSLAAAGADERLARLLLERGPALIAAGDGDAVVRAARALPAHRVDAAVCRLVGEALQLRGEWDEALSYLSRAAEGEHPPRAGTAWRIGLMHYLRGQPDWAVEVYERCVPGRDAVREEALLAAWSASAYWARGELGRCRELATRALELATACADSQALAVAHTARSLVCVLEGDRAGNDLHYRSAMRHAERAGDVVQLIRIRTNRAAHHIEEADYPRALEELHAALPLAELAGFATFHALGLHNRGETYRFVGRLDEAIVDLNAAREQYRRIGSHHVCRPLRALGDVYRERGDLALARACYEEAIGNALACGEVRCLTLCWSGMARLLAAEEPERAMELAERALTRASGPARRTALLAVGWVALARGESVRAVRMAASAAAEARRQRDRADLAAALHLRALADPPRTRPLLHEAVALCRDIGNPLGQAQAELDLARTLLGPAARQYAEAALRRAQDIGAHGTAVAAAALLDTLRDPAGAHPPVAIRTLGGFQVLLAGRPVPASAWQSRKARDLVKILVTRRGRPIARAALMEALWPGEDRARLGNRLSVALSTARSVLDPGREFGPDHYLVADTDTVHIDRGHLAVDVEEFLADATAGLSLRSSGRATDAARAGDLLARAATVYLGDFLEADAYDDWARPLREEARAVYIQAARALAEDALATGEYDAACRHLLRVLERDPYDERAHLALVAALTAARSHGEARRRYREYVTRMAEIDVEAAPFPHPTPH